MKKLIYLTPVILLSALFLAAAVSAEDDLRNIKRNRQERVQQKEPQWRALVIGISDYRSTKIPDLKTPVADARSVAEILHEGYGFQVTTLLNDEATWRGIDNELRKLRKETGPEDSVLIYYGGHGDLDQDGDEGWWYPYDAEPGNRQTYLKNSDLRQSMKQMVARHVLLVSDSCFAGSLFADYRSAYFSEGDSYHKRLYQAKSRRGLTAGGKEPVLDRGRADHSIFAYHFLSYLEKPEQPVFSAGELYQSIAPVITNNSPQKPVYLPVLYTGDELGEFIFIREGADLETFVSQVARKPRKRRSTPELILLWAGIGAVFIFGAALVISVRPRIMQRRRVGRLRIACERRDLNKLAALVEAEEIRDDELARTAARLLRDVKGICLSCKNKSIFIAPGPQQGIGRGDRWALAVADPHVSRKPHCWLAFSDDKLVLTADGGVIAAAKEVQRIVALKAGDHVTLGRKSVVEVTRFVPERLAILTLSEGPRTGNVYVMGMGDIAIADILGRADLTGSFYWQDNRVYLRQPETSPLLARFAGRTMVALVDGDLLHINGMDWQVKF